MKISVVTSLYHSAEHIEELYFRVRNTLAKITADYEIILVNDGSPDNSLDTALSIYNKENSKLKIVDLSRNYGQHKALLTGLKYATGDIIFMMDSDLEEDPELIERFWNEYINSKEEIDVIFGVQSIRKGKFLEKWSGKIFYKLFNLLSAVKVIDNPTPFRLMTKRYVNALLEFREREVFFLGISLLAGFKQKAIGIDKHNFSPSGYSFFKKNKQSIDAITSFSNKPLLFIFYLGVITSLLAFIFLVSVFVLFIFYGVRVEGWMSIIASIWVVGGVIILCLGIIGIYLSKIFIEVKRRPYTIIKNIYE